MWKNLIDESKNLQRNETIWKDIHLANSMDYETIIETMKIKIKKTELSRSLAISSKAINTSASIPILHQVLIKTEEGGIKALGTNLDVAITSSAKAEILESGSVAVNAIKLLEISNRLQVEEVSIESDSKFAISIKAGKSSFRMNGLNPSDFPETLKVDNAKSFSIEQLKLKSLIESCEFAVSQDSTRYALNGFLFEISESGLIVAAADGRRLAKIESSSKLTPARFTLPLKPAIEIASLCSGESPIEIAFNENKVIAKAESFTVSSKLIDALFPNIYQILPKSYAVSASVDRKNLIDSIARAAIVTNEKSSGVKLFFGKNSTNITAQSSEFGDAAEEVDSKLEGSPVEISLNPKYLIEALEASTCDTVKILLNDSRSPLAVSDEKYYICVISPLLPK